MSDVIDIIRAVVRDELKSLRLGDLAVVKDVFPHAEGDANNYECSVKLRESELELRRVPIATPHTGMVSTPRIGDLVLISYVSGDPNRPIVVGRLYTDETTPPEHAQDEWRVHAPYGGETSIAIDKESSVVITAGETVITLKKGDVVSIKTPKDLVVEAQGNVQLKASGNIDLGEGGGGVITTNSHKCYYSGAPLIGSQTVKAKG